MSEAQNQSPNQDVQDSNSTSTAAMESSDATKANAAAAKTNSEGEGGAGDQQQKKKTTTTKTKKRKTSSITVKSAPKGPRPPDGGWGWMVVLSSFMISVFVDGVCFSIGIFFTPFREHYKTSKAETAWVGSVLNGTYLSIGPIVGACVNRYGCRKMTMLGAVLATVSFFLSTFATSISQLIATFGFAGGVGFGFVYLPAMVMVGYYFEKRRALATGIACCGSGIGSFIFAPFSNLLLETYGWKGATWIMSAIVLNGLVFGIFYRPLEMSPDDRDPEAAEDEENGGEEEEEPSPELPLLAKAGVDQNGDKFIKEVPPSLTSPDDAERLKKKTKKPPPVLNPDPDGVGTVGGDSSSGGGLLQDRDAQGNKIIPPRIVFPDICIEVTPPGQGEEKAPPPPAQLSSEKNGIKPEGMEMTILDRGGTGLTEKNNHHNGSNNKIKVDDDEGLVKLRESLMTSVTKPERPLSDILYTTTVTPQIRAGSRSPASETFRSEIGLTKKQDDNNAVNPIARLAYSHDAFSQLRIRKPQSHGHQHHHHLDVASPLQRKDIFYSGSLRHIPEYQSSESIDDYRRKVMTVEEVVVKEGEEEEEDGQGEGGEEGVVVVGKKRGLIRRMVVGPLLQVFDVSLLKSPTFCIYGLSCFLCMLGFFVPFIYLPTLCLDLGMGTSKAAFLISIIGIANTIGRVGVGFVSDQPWADCLLINNVALMIGGACTCCVPFFSGLYPLFAAYTFVFGTSIAVFVSLRSIIMVELMGLQKLTNAFGLVIMCQGISTFIGAPIAGMLSDLTGDYNISFFLAGLLMALSGIICLPLRRIAVWEANRANKKAEKKREEEVKEEEEDAQRRRLVKESSAMV